MKAASQHPAPLLSIVHWHSTCAIQRKTVLYCTLVFEWVVSVVVAEMVGEVGCGKCRRIIL